MILCFKNKVLKKITGEDRLMLRGIGGRHDIIIMTIIILTKESNFIWIFYRQYESEIINKCF